LPSDDPRPPAQVRRDGRSYPRNADSRAGGNVYGRARTPYTPVRQGPAGYGPAGYGPPAQSVRPPAPYGEPPLLENNRRIRTHGSRRRRVPVLGVIALVLGVVAVGAGLRYLPGSPLAASNPAGGSGPSAAVTTTPPPVPLPFHSAPVTVDSVNTSGFLSWALMDRRSGEIVGSANMDQTITTASMVKAWLAADYLRQNASPSKSRLADLSTMIRDSDNGAGERTYNAVGRTASIRRLISICQLTVAIKNGWLARSDDHGNWHVSCLAIGDTWVVAVLQRYPPTSTWDADFAHTQQVALDTARLLLNPDAQP
jgi:hypothetical protein